jgi:hypothetical protein
MFNYSCFNLIIIIINVLYKRGVYTSEAFTLLTLRTSKAAHLNYLKAKNIDIYIVG